MRPRVLLCLFALALGLGAFIWFWERKQPGSDERTRRGKQVFAVKADEVTALEFSWGDKMVRLERPKAAVSSEEGEEGEEVATAAVVDRDWRLAQPFQARADRAAVDSLLSTLVDLQKERTLVDGDRDALGLSTPRARVRVEAGEKKLELAVGEAIPASSSVAVALQGEPEVFITSGAFFTDLTKEPGDWRSRDLFSGQRHEVERLAWGAGGGRLVLARRGETFWLESPFADRADRDLLERLLNEVTGLKVKAFVDQPAGSLAERGLAPPIWALEVALKGKAEPFRLELGNGPIGRVGDQVFETESKVAEILAQPPEDWRSPMWSGLETYQVEQASLEDATGTVELSRSGGDWQRTISEKTDKISFTPVSDLLYAVAGARGEDILTRAEAVGRGASLEKPRLTLSLKTTDGTEDLLMLYPALADGHAPALAKGRDAVLLLAPATFAEIESKVEQVRKAEPLAPEPAPQADES